LRHDLQVRRIGPRPLLGRPHPHEPLAGLGVAHLLASVPHEATDVERVVEDAERLAGGPADRRPCPTPEAATTGGVRWRHAFVVQDVDDGLGSVASDVKLEDADDDRGLLAIDHAAGADHAMVLVQDGLASIAISAAAGTQTAADLPEHAPPGLV